MSRASFESRLKGAVARLAAVRRAAGVELRTSARRERARRRARVPARAPVAAGRPRAGDDRAPHGPPGARGARRRGGAHVRGRGERGLARAAAGGRARCWARAIRAAGRDRGRPPRPRLAGHRLAGGGRRRGHEPARRGEFGRRQGDALRLPRRASAATIASRIDFREEIGGTGERASSTLARILHIEDDGGPDVAFLQVTPRTGDPLARRSRSRARTPRAAAAGRGHRLSRARQPHPRAGPDAAHLRQRLRQEAPRARPGEARRERPRAPRLLDARRQLRLGRARPRDRRGAGAALQRPLPRRELRGAGPHRRRAAARRPRGRAAAERHGRGAARPPTAARRSRSAERASRIPLGHARRGR